MWQPTTRIVDTRPRFYQASSYPLIFLFLIQLSTSPYAADIYLQICSLTSSNHNNRIAGHYFVYCNCLEGADLTVTVLCQFKNNETQVLLDFTAKQN